MQQKEELLEELMSIRDAITTILERVGRVDDHLDDGRLDSLNPPGAYSHLERANYLIGIVESELESELGNT